MIPFINFNLIAIQFDHITSDIGIDILQNIVKQSTLMWMGIIVSLIIITWVIRLNLAHLWKNSPIIPIFIASFSPFLIMNVTLYALGDEPYNSVLLLLHSIVSFWLAMSLLRIPLKILNFFNRRLFYTASSFFALSGVILLFKQLSEIASSHFYFDAVSLFTLLELFSKMGIITGLYLYGHMLIPILLARWSHIFPAWISIWALRFLLRTLFLITAVLWLVNILSISLKALMLLFIGSVLIGILVMIRNHTEWFINNLYHSQYYTPLELENISYHFQKSILLLSLLFIYKLTPLFTELQRLSETCQSVILVKTSLLDLSLLQLINAVFVFNLLYSILFVIAKRIRVFRTFRNSINAKSIEALTLNIGLLVILTFAFIQMDISWRVFVPIAGALGIGFGFGLQTILNNYMSGFIVLYAKKLRIGDIVELPGNAGRAVGNSGDTIIGTVETIDILSTTLKTVDGIEISIPNSFFIAEKIINYSQTSPFVRVKIAVGVDYASDLDLVEKLIIEAMDECDDIEHSMDKGVIFIQFGSSSLDLAPYFWTNIRTVKALGILKGELMGRMLSKFRENGISIPFPRSDITIRNPLTVQTHMEE
jgi:small-conductance mechanosensitive channel